MPYVLMSLSNGLYVVVKRLKNNIEIMQRIPVSKQKAIKYMKALYANSPD